MGASAAETVAGLVGKVRELVGSIPGIGKMLTASNPLTFLQEAGRATGLVEPEVHTDPAKLSVPPDADLPVPFDAKNGDDDLGLQLNADGSFTVPQGRGIRRISATAIVGVTGGGGAITIQILKAGENRPYLYDVRPSVGAARLRPA